MQAIVLLEAFDCENVSTFLSSGQRQASVDSPAVHKDRAGAAGTYVTPFLGAEKVQCFPEHIQQTGVRRDERAIVPAVNRQRHMKLRRMGHGGDYPDPPAFFQSMGGI